MTLCRVIGVIFLTAFANQYRLHKLKAVDQFVMAYGGLRGAIAFALVSQLDGETMGLKKNMLVATTIAVVFWTCFVQGITIKPLVQFLEVKRASEKDPNMNERIAGNGVSERIDVKVKDLMCKFCQAASLTTSCRVLRVSWEA